MAALWFTPVCDDLLKKMARWLAGYEMGEVYSTRDWIAMDGNKVDRPTRYLHRVAFKPVEWQHLTRIMETLAPKNELVKDLKAVEASMQRRFTDMPVAKRPRLLTNGEWLIPLAYWKQDLEEAVAALLRAKTGQTETMETIAEQQKKDGKELFEV